MTYKMKSIRYHVIRGFWTMVGALAFWVITYGVIWPLADGNMVIAYVGNLVTILVCVVEDNFRYHWLHEKKKSPFKSRVLTILFEYFFLEKYSTATMKSSLYLFYIIALATSHILTLNPYLEVSGDIRSYFTVVGFGLIILIAVDKFYNQFVKYDIYAKYDKYAESTKNDNEE